jgi:hypothetical protein
MDLNEYQTLALRTARSKDQNDELYCAVKLVK